MIAKRTYVTLAILAIAGILFFGCCGSIPTIPTGNQGEATGFGGQQQGSPTSGTNGQTTQQGSQGGSNGQSGSSGSNSGDIVNDLTGKTYAQLVALGVPIQCDITSTYQGETTSMKVYMKGQDDVRSEITSSTSSESTCRKIVAIVTEKTTSYIGCADGSFELGSAPGPMNGCKWLKMTIKGGDTSGSPGYSSGYAAPDFSGVPSAQINCVPWIYEPAKFSPPAGEKVCDMDELMKAYGAE